MLAVWALGNSHEADGQFAVPGQDMTERTSQEAHESQSRPPRQRRLHLREVTTEAGDYDGLGADLKAARVRNGLDLAEVSDELRIRRVHLHAMEEGLFNDLPAPVYAVGFVRSYADYLGLDGEVAVEAFKQEASGLGGETKLVFPSPIPESRVPTGWLIALSLVLAGLIYAGWYYAEMNGRLATDRVAPVPERLVALAPAPTAEQPAIDDSVPVGPVETEETPVEGPKITDTVTGISPATTDVRVELRQVDTPDAELGTEGEGRTSGAAPSAQLGPQEEPTGTVTITPDVIARSAEEATPVAEPDNSETMAAVVESPAPGEESSVPADQRAAPSSFASMEGRAIDRSNAVSGSEVAPAVTPETRAPPLSSAPPLRAEANIQPENVLPGRQTRIYGEGNWDARVIVRAKNESWVQIMSRDGELLLTRILRPGDQYLVPNRDDLFLMTGNAGGIEITVDGELVPAIGQPGDIRSNVALVPDRLIAGTAIEP